jgi:hypothetical protein
MCRSFINELGLLDHHHRIRTARYDATGCDRGACASRNRDGRHTTARNDFSVERQQLGFCVACADGIGGAHGEPIDIRPVKWRRIDCRDDIPRQHARTRFGKRYAFSGKRRKVEVAFKPAARFIGRHDLKELFLPRSGPHTRDQFCVPARA